MTAAILCPGPSLTRSWLHPWSPYALTIAVNRALADYPRADWLSAGDGETLTWCDERHLQPVKGVITFQSEIPLWKPRWHSRLRWVAWESFAPSIANAFVFNWSIQAAMLLAWSLKHTDMEIYGHDCRGSHYSDGSACIQKNWADLAQQTMDCMHWLADRYCKIRMIRPPETGVIQCE
jgi:hypothetical protein